MTPPPGRPDGRARGHGRRRLRLVLPSLVVLVATTGCDGAFGWPTPVTKQGQEMYDLWKGTCIAALVVAGFVWLLILWSIFRYRKRSEEIPRQVRYNLPIEVLYTVVPFVIIGALFYYTARDETDINKTGGQALTVDVTAFRWNWDFGYEGTMNGIDMSRVAHSYGQPGAPAVLRMPVGVPVLFKESSRDVIHSFWVPEFLFKRDVIPGRQNSFQLTATKPGRYIGHCAELCGVNHDQMDFYVDVMSMNDFTAFAQQGTASGPSADTPAGAPSPSYPNP